MPTPPQSNNSKDKAPEDRPTTAQKPPLSKVNQKGAKKKTREDRLADALRDNLRRRKADGAKNKDE